VLAEHILDVVVVMVALEVLEIHVMVFQQGAEVVLALVVTVAMAVVV